jgi:hypothetical protein
MKVTVLKDGFDSPMIHRFGNYNNWVADHDCVCDVREPKLHGKDIRFRIDYVEPTDEVKERVRGIVQQQAVMRAFVDFDRPRVRSKFKKSMLAQAQAYLAGNGQFTNPYSPAQAVAIITSEPSEARLREQWLERAQRESKQYIIIRDGRKSHGFGTCNLGAVWKHIRLINGFAELLLHNEYDHIHAEYVIEDELKAASEKLNTRYPLTLDNRVRLFVR